MTCHVYFVCRKTLQHSRQEELRSNETEFEQQLAVLNDSHQTKLEQVFIASGVHVCVRCVCVYSVWYIMHNSGQTRIGGRVHQDDG